MCVEFLVPFMYALLNLYVDLLQQEQITSWLTYPEDVRLSNEWHDFFLEKRKSCTVKMILLLVVVLQRKLFFQNKIEKISQMEVRRIIFVCLKSVKILGATPARNRKVNFGRDRTKL